MLMLEIMATCESSFSAPMFSTVLRVNKTGRDVHRQVCRIASAPRADQTPVYCRGFIIRAFLFSLHEDSFPECKADVKTNHVLSGKTAKRDKEMANDELPLVPN